jgi:hypothetical protein
VCAAGWCLEACPFGLPPGAATGAAACAPGLECAPVEVAWPVSTTAGACAPPCDPFADVPDRDCAGGRVCVSSAVATPAQGHCLPATGATVDEGEPCSPWTARSCASGLVCAASGPRRAAVCVRACRAGAAPGERGGCPAGERCFRHFDALVGAFAPWGTCAAACAPFAPEGETGCPPAAACEPRDRDAATGRLVGRCFDRDSGTEGQPCLSSEPYAHPGCAPGLACLLRLEDGARCRRLCDAQAARTGEGACPAGSACERAWPASDDPVLAGCLPR